MKMFFLALLAIFVLGVIFAGRMKASPKAVVVINGRTRYYVDVARDPISQARGLSGREKMGEAEGMLFVFSQPLPRYFWMNDMKFPLDFVWIRDRKIIGINENVPEPAQNNGEIYRLGSPEPADMVLELNAGQIQARGIQVGDSIQFDEAASASS